jgi:hypothetical protein
VSSYYRFFLIGKCEAVPIAIGIPPCGRKFTLHIPEGKMPLKKAKKLRD